MACRWRSKPPRPRANRWFHGPTESSLAGDGEHSAGSTLAGVSGAGSPWHGCCTGSCSTLRAARFCIPCQPPACCRSSRCFPLSVRFSPHHVSPLPRHRRSAQFVFPGGVLEGIQREGTAGIPPAEVRRAGGESPDQRRGRHRAAELRAGGDRPGVFARRAGVE